MLEKRSMYKLERDNTFYQIWRKNPGETELYLEDNPFSTDEELTIQYAKMLQTRADDGTAYRKQSYIVVETHDAVKTIHTTGVH